MLENLIQKFLYYKQSWTFWIKEKIFFFRQISYLLRWGVWVLESIKLVKENTDKSSIVYICDTIYNSLKKWESFSRSIGKLPNYFNDWDVNIIKSWETSWELVNVLNYLAKEYEFLYDVKNKYLSAMVYPLFLFVLAIVALYVIFRFVLPWIISIVEQFEDMTLPLTTEIMIYITNFIADYNVTIIIFLWLLIFGFSIFLGIDEGKKAVDKLKFKVPLLGKLTKYYYLIRFLRYKKLLLNSGMSYINVYKSLKWIFDNVEYQNMINDVLESINKWDPIIWKIQNHTNIIPNDVILLMKTWEETASLETSLENSLWLYEEEFERDINNISKILEPVLIVVVGWIIAFIALAIFWITGSIIDSIW